MIKVGIVAFHKESDLIYEDYYKVQSIYLNRVKEAFALPVILTDIKLASDCDAFIIPGGHKIDKLCYQLIEYAIRENKPLLGICMGMQALCLYDRLISKIGKFDIELFFDELKKPLEERVALLTEIKDDSHGGSVTRKENILNDDLINSRHNITVLKDSFLYDIYKKNTLDVISLHKYYCNFELKLFNKIAFKDNVLEAIEYKDKNNFIIGLQFHPEIEDNTIINYFVNEVRRRLN